MNKKLVKVTIAVALLAAGAALSQAANDGTGLNRCDWLNIGIGGKPVAMGSAYSAIGNDVNSLFWNPAGLAKASKSQMMVQYGAWLGGVGYHAAAFNIRMPSSQSPNPQAAMAAQQTGSSSMYEQYFSKYYGGPSAAQEVSGGLAIAAGVTLLSAGSMATTDDTGTPGTGLSPSGYAAMGSFAYAFGRSASIGVTAKMINENLTGGTADSGMAFDAGAIVGGGSNGTNFSVGGVVQNVGGSIGGTALPMTIRAGAGLSLGAITGAVDMTMPTGDTTKISVGGEFKLGAIALRGGYVISGMTAADYGKASVLPTGVSVGCGFDTGTLDIDFAVSGWGAAGSGANSLGMPVNFSLVLGF